MTNESAILGLLAELYREKALLQAEVSRLAAEVAALAGQVTDEEADDAGQAPRRPHPTP